MFLLQREATLLMLYLTIYAYSVKKLQYCWCSKKDFYGSQVAWFRLTFKNRRKQRDANLVLTSAPWL